MVRFLVSLLTAGCAVMVVVGLGLGLVVGGVVVGVWVAVPWVAWGRGVFGE